MRCTRPLWSRSTVLTRSLAKNFSNTKILAGEPITDRKSKFQGFIAPVNSVEEVQEVLDQLTSNKKIGNATHNMVAYRITQMNANNGVTQIIEDRDDDGEGGAGDKMLYVLQTKKAENLVVVVTRWYGGTPLGQARFKHICACTLQVLELYWATNPTTPPKQK